MFAQLVALNRICLLIIYHDVIKGYIDVTLFRVLRVVNNIVCVTFNQSQVVTVPKIALKKH